MMRILLGVVAASGFGTLAGNVALQQFFDVTLMELWNDLDDRGPVFIAALALPVIFWIVRGWLGFLITMVVIAGAMTLALKYGVGDDAPLKQVVTMAAMYSVVAVIVYKTLVNRIFG